VSGDPDTALQHIAAYREQGKQVVVDERNIFVARQSDTCLLVRGKSGRLGSKASLDQPISCVD
jgi:hypothetical protein